MGINKSLSLDCSPPSVCVSDSSGNVNSIPEVSPHSSTDKPDRQELPTGLDRSPSSNSSCGRHNFDVKVEDRGPDEDQMEMADELATTGGKKPDPEGISNSSRLSFSVEDGHYRARSRLMFDPITELPALKRWFEETPHPSWLQIDHFTEALNAMPYRQTYPAVTSHNVKIWFKNRRAKNKRTGGDT